MPHQSKCRGTTNGAARQGVGRLENQKQQHDVTPTRKWAGRLAAAVASVGLVVGVGSITAGPASASTFCGETGDGGFGCVIDQGDGTFKMANSNGDIVYNW
jgi:hypothetical protein